MIKYIYLNGKIIPSSKALVSIYDIGFLRGYGVFDYLRTYNGKPFLLIEHLKRFRSSAKELSLQVPVNNAGIEKIIQNLLNKNKFKESSLRLVLTGGELVGGLNYNPKKPTFAILVESYHKQPESIFEKGVKLVTYDHQRFLPEAKTVNYITAVLLQQWREKNNAFEILYTNNGKILEPSTSNFFAFIGDTLVTPKNDILIGTTRNLVLKLAKSKFKIEERDLAIKEVSKFTEAFITGTNKEILPVVQINKKMIKKGKVGLNTKYLLELYRKYTEKQ